MRYPAIPNLRNHLQITGYRCVKCNEFRDVNYAGQYCQFCGTKQPDESRLQLSGYAIYQPLGPKSIRNVDEINAFLVVHSGKLTRIWSYVYGIAGLDIRIRISDEQNSIIRCGNTQSIVVQNLSWPNAIHVETTQKPGSPDLIVINDSRANVEIKCESVHLIPEVEPFF